jgi:hypothetical protein
MQVSPLLDDQTWQKLLPVLRQQPGIYIGSEAQCRRFIEAVLWIDRWVLSGGSCQSATGTGIVCSSALTDGVSGASGNRLTSR